MIDPFTIAQTHPSLETRPPVQTHTMLEKTGVAGAAEHRCIGLVTLIEQGQHGLLAILVAEDFDALGNPLQPLPRH